MVIRAGAGRRRIHGRNRNVSSLLAKLACAAGRARSQEDSPVKSQAKSGGPSINLQSEAFPGQASPGHWGGEPPSLDAFHFPLSPK